MASEQSIDLGDVDQQWNEFKTKFNKNYEKEEEETMRKAVFVENLKKIKEHNKKYEAGEVTWSQGINHLSDLTPEEFSKQCCGVRRPGKKE